MNPDFGQLLRAHRDRLGLSRNALAHRAGCDPSYLTRIEQGTRAAPTVPIVVALARQLHLTTGETQDFFVAAGHVPPALDGMWADETVLAVARTLAHPGLAAEDRAEFAHVVQTIARRYHPGSRRNGSPG